MARMLTVVYDERGFKIGKMKFYLDGVQYLSLANHENGQIVLPDANEHIITARIWGWLPIYKGRLPAGNAHWRLVFQQDDPTRMGRFTLTEDYGISVEG